MKATIYDNFNLAKNPQVHKGSCRMALGSAPFFLLHFLHFLPSSYSTILVELFLFYYVTVAVVEYSIPISDSDSDGKHLFF